MTATPLWKELDPIVFAARNTRFTPLQADQEDDETLQTLAKSPGVFART